jgi:hypothetical protein
MSAVPAVTNAGPMSIAEGFVIAREYVAVVDSSWATT